MRFLKHAVLGGGHMARVHYSAGPLINARVNALERLVERLASTGGQPCPHDRTTTHFTGDNIPVEYCPDCGRNVAIDGKALP